MLFPTLNIKSAQYVSEDPLGKLGEEILDKHNMYYIKLSHNARNNRPLVLCMTLARRHNQIANP